MAFSIFQTQPIELNTTNATIEDRIFDIPVVLPTGNWEITIDSGDAWIFTARGNHVCYTNDSLTITPEDGPPRIKGLFIRSVVKFTATRLD